MSMSDKKVAFLVDFDNVATDVIEQALNMVFKDYGTAHIRRAYCNAEQAHHQQAFMKRLGLRAIVNLAIGKNSTDIALAADAMDIAITERPDVIVLVSSDSDFAPLVLRLREKGAWLRGFGQYGKTGDGVIQIYDQFNELAHGTGRSSRDAAPAKPAGGGRGRGRNGGRAGGTRPVADAPRGTPAPRPPRTDASAPLPAPTMAEPVLTPAAVTAAPAALESASAVPPALPVDIAPAAAAVADAPTQAVAQPAAKPAAKTANKPAGKRAGRSTKALPAEAPAPAASAPAQVPPDTAPATKPKDALPAEHKSAARPAAKAAATAEDPQVAAAKEINAVLALLPKLIDGQWHDLGAAAKVLKDAGLLAKSAPATKLFRKHAHAFELQPEKQPNRVRFAT
ncbi:NYN domain-containing protein [Roseateles sp. LKC17W]|uniref:NYN domain-containing protein n=1 Tax=Pelomonas margarita TaxID=3299031 RepID=A0ABW7FK76_9BURK